MYSQEAMLSNRSNDGQTDFFDRSIEEIDHTYGDVNEFVISCVGVRQRVQFSLATHFVSII
jgi:hypothetical protein